MQKIGKFMERVKNCKKGGRFIIKKEDWKYKTDIHRYFRSSHSYTYRHDMKVSIHQMKNKMGWVVTRLK